MKIKFLFSILLLQIIFFSCGKDFHVDNSPKSDYNLFFEYLKKDYAYRDYHSFTMEELRLKYYPEIESSNTIETLTKVLKKIERNELADPHVYVRFPEPYADIYVEQNPWPDLDYSYPLFKEISIIKQTPYFTYGFIKSESKIGYIHISNFISDLGGTSSLGIDDGIKEIDDIIGTLISNGAKSLVLDMRSEAGGTSYIPRFIAQRFIDRPVHYMTEYYPEGNTFIKKKWQIVPDGKGFRTQKIALLSNGLTGSGGEMFVLALIQRKNLIHIGSRTIGAPGNIVEKDLSNGWNFIIANSRTEYPDGKQYYKVGILPSIIVENDSTYGITTFNDKVIEKAIELLR